MTEKKINNYLIYGLDVMGVFLRLFVTAVGYSINNSIDNTLLTRYDMYTGVITELIILWNGVYFMNQVVVNYPIENHKKIEKIKDYKFHNL